jgi:hypothetical protein
VTHGVGKVSSAVHWSVDLNGLVWRGCGGCRLVSLVDGVLKGGIFLFEVKTGVSLCKSDMQKWCSMESCGNFNSDIRFVDIASNLSCCFKCA